MSINRDITTIFIILTTTIDGKGGLLKVGTYSILVALLPNLIRTRGGLFEVHHGRLELSLAQ